MKWVYMILFWIPFAFSAFLCGLVLKDRDAASPAFYSFLPMTFFFVAVGFMELVRRIRALESQQGGSGGGNAAPGPRLPSDRATPRQSTFPNECTLFSAPVDWAGGMVRTPVRYAFVGVFLTAFIALAIYESGGAGWRAGLGLGVCVAIYQLMILYALRRLYLQLAPPQAP